MSRDRGDESRWGGLAWGLMLITLGVAFLAQRQGFLPWDVFRHWWPAIVVTMGLIEVLGARTAKKLGSGVTMMLMGGYFFVSVLEYRGLDWSNSWPLALVAIGAGMVVETVAAGFMPRGKDDCGPRREQDDE
ncbi:MAG: hypothetical protein IT348_03560 [Candidatus Eisenbacteria bacterium]|nr:hypothetical protein [Candidatus Eisenbacteria bacterium]